MKLDINKTMILNFNQFINENLKFNLSDKLHKIPDGLATKYTFGYENYNFIVDASYIIQSNNTYYVEFDFLTKESKFNLIKIENPFHLLSTIKNIIKDSLLKFSKKYPNKLSSIQQFYVNDASGPEAGIRSKTFNRAILSALRELNINYSYSSKPEIGATKASFVFHKTL